MTRFVLIQICVVLCVIIHISQGLKRCFECRSRGELGSCKDPFHYGNVSSMDHIIGVKTVPCATGWCVKVLEGGANSFKDEEYGMATERFCMVRVPSDSEERCAPTVRSNTKVMMCFCQGDLCNSASVFVTSGSILIFAFILFLYMS